MPDIVDRDTRSRMMSGIRGRNTQPEIAVRRHLHRAGFRYRLHDKRLPGRPDIVLPRYRTVVEVRGCFWHRHPGCRLATTPGTNVGFWREKFRLNVERDARNTTALRELGWKTLIVWACELDDGRRLAKLVDEIRS